MKIVLLLTVLVSVTLASCLTSKKTKYDTVYKMQDYGIIESIKKFRKPIYLRYHITNVALDIWSNGSNQYIGKTICYTVRHTKRGYKSYGINFHVADSVVSKIMNEFNTLGIAEILKTDTVQRYWSCNDCGIDEYEYFDGHNYFQKSHFSIKAHKAIDSFSKFISMNIDPDKRFFELIDHLPKGTYQRNMMEVIKE
jgi:hypothetical protein